MAADSEPSFVDLLIFTAPEGESPFAFAANYITYLLPAKPNWYFKQIIATGVLNAVSFILTLVSFFIVARRRKAANEVGSLWFFRTRYGHPSRIPYIMPNPLTMFLVWNAIFSLLMQPYTWLNYFAWKYPSRAVTSKVYFWYGFVFIFDGAGMWLSAFGTLYATLLPRVLFSSERKISIMLHPTLLNTMCFTMPALLTLTQVITASLSQVAWSKAVNLQFDLIENLWVLSSQWIASNGTSIDANLRQQVSVDGTSMMSALTDSRKAFVRNAWASAAWYFLCMVLFSPTAIWLLVTLKRAAGQLSQSSRSVSGNPSSLPRRQKHGPALVEQSAVREQSSQKRALRRAYVTAALQFIATFICLMVGVGSFMWVSIDIDRVATNPVAHAVAILMSDWTLAIAGTIINILIIVRMTGNAEATGSHPSHPYSSRHTELHTVSNTYNVAEQPPSPSRADFEIQKPIPLRIISTQQTASDTELGVHYKVPLSSNDGHSYESFGNDKHNRI
ncbi:unnamed protein product [Rhizoctonia solani]|uniref:Transmembrane protein n=2 Tax=Rhizoctonia solani TaxID=456999 RepID=A0A8H3HFQ5_9AGAM|nr:transmembrane protein, putative [Rhizoctonia solani AG-3 Rhs1AP]CAE6478680.1 unnamed protein product [Rhizoctonia solani]CAE6504432.1 unnamed protein product [Rhizoctonia solani]